MTTSTQYNGKTVKIELIQVTSMPWKYTTCHTEYTFSIKIECDEKEATVHGIECIKKNPQEFEASDLLDGLWTELMNAHYGQQSYMDFVAGFMEGDDNRVHAQWLSCVKSLEKMQHLFGNSVDPLEFAECLENN